jgi:adenylate cyclase
VAEAVPHLAVLEAGEVVLRGKSHALKLFALVGDESLAAASEFRELARLHASLLAAAEVGRSDARAMLETCRALAGPWFAPFYARLEERLVSRP